MIDSDRRLNFRLPPICALKLYFYCKKQPQINQKIKIKSTISKVLFRLPIILNYE